MPNDSAGIPPFDAKHRNISGKTMTDATYDSFMFSVLRRDFSPLRHAAKLLGRLADVSPRTAENYLAGRHAPAGDKLVTLLANRPDLETEFADLVRRRRTELRERSFRNIARADRALGGNE